MADEHIKAILYRYPDKTEIRGTIIRKNGETVSCAIYYDRLPNSFYFFSHYQHGAHPPDYKSKEFECSYVSSFPCPSPENFDTFMESSPKAKEPETTEDLRGRWIKCLKDNVFSITWSRGDYKQITSNEGTHLHLEGGYVCNLKSDVELMPPGFDPPGFDPLAGLAAKESTVRKHISCYTEQMSVGQYREGQLKAIGDRLLRGALYKAVEGYYFLHNEDYSHGSIPNGGIPVGCPFTRSWDVGNYSSSKFNQIDPFSFVPTSPVYGCYGNSTEKKVEPVVEPWSLVGRYIRTPQGATRQISVHHHSGLVYCTCGTEDGINLHQYEKPDKLNSGYELLPVDFKPGVTSVPTAKLTSVSEDLAGRYIRLTDKFHPSGSKAGDYWLIQTDGDRTLNNMRCVYTDFWGSMTVKRIIDGDVILMPKGWHPSIAGGEAMAKTSDPVLDYLVVGMGKPAEIQPVVMFSRTKDKRVMAPLEAMQPVLQISKLKTNK